jgi:hypothetical protein
VKRITLLVFLFLALFFMTGIVSGGDTGTYRILDYRVSLTPRSDGTVDVQYYQKWLVTGGVISWITVGTPNDNFTTVGHGGAVNQVSSASQGGWNGVRLDLDKDYREGKVFEVFFEIIERNLFYADKEDYRLEFTPGWYDRAVTDTLSISVKFFAKLETVKARPEPTVASEQEMTWIRSSLERGERFSISVSFPRRLFPGVSGQQSPTEAGKRGQRESSSGGTLAFIIFLVIMLVVFFIFPASRRRGYSGGRMFYGGLFGSGSGKGAGGSSRSTGGGGGFGGSSFSCACACVSCACACACAGGGGAGCSKKLHHSCSHCEPGRLL